MPEDRAESEQQASHWSDRIATALAIITIGHFILLYGLFNHGFSISLSLVVATIVEGLGFVYLVHGSSKFSRGGSSA